MNSLLNQGQVQMQKKGLDILKVINQHFDEIPECKHSIKEIMKQALEIEKEIGVRPTTSEPPQENHSNHQNQVLVGNDSTN